MVRTKTSPLQRGMSMVLAVLMLMSMFVFKAGAADETVDLSQGNVVVTVNADGTATIDQASLAQRSIGANEKITLTNSVSVADSTADVEVKLATTANDPAVDIVLDGAVFSTDGMKIDTGAVVNLTVKGSTSVVAVTGDVNELTVEDGTVVVTDDVAKLTVENGSVTVTTGTVTDAEVSGGNVKAVITGDAVITGGNFDGSNLTGATSIKDAAGNYLDENTIVTSITNTGEYFVLNDTNEDYLYGAEGIAAGNVVLYTRTALDTLVGVGDKEVIDVLTGFTFDYVNDTVTATTATAGAYYVNSDTGTTPLSDSTPTTIVWENNKYSLTKQSSVSELLNSVTEVVATRAAAPVVTDTTDASTDTATDGTIVVDPYDSSATYQTGTDDGTGLITYVDATSAAGTSTEGSITGLKAGTYYVRVKATSSTFASDAATATVKAAATSIDTPVVVITTDGATALVDSTGAALTSAAFTAYDGSYQLLVTTATYTSPKYQWYLNGNAIDGATSNVLLATQEGTYTVKVTDGSLSSTSAEVKLEAISTLDAPVIEAPTTTDLSGGSITLQVENADTTGAITYTWYLDGVQCATGVDSITVTASDPGTYTVKASNSAYTSKASEPVTLTSGSVARPVVSASAEGADFANSGKVTLTVTNTTAYTSASYQWYHNGSAVGTDSAEYEADAVGEYYVIVTDTVSGTPTASDASATVTLYQSGENGDVTITATPEVLIAGKTVDLTATVATGTGTATITGYQWYVDGVAINSANGATYDTLTGVTQAGNYTVEVTFSDGQVKSAEATVNLSNSKFTVSATAKSYISSKTTLTAVVDGLTDDELAAATVTWTAASTSNTATQDTTDRLKCTTDGYGTYMVTVNYNGIVATASVYTYPSSGSTGTSSSNTQYTLTFETNGGSTISSKTFDKDTVVTLSDYTTTKTGYSFAGWYSDKDLTTAVTKVTMTKSTTVYAKWEQATSLLDTVNHYAYIVGYNDGTFRPTNDVTRAETATMLYRLLTSSARSENSTSSNSFKDVSSSNWYNTAVSTMSELGVINGYSNGSFGGDSSITRAEFAVMVARLSSNTYSGDDKFDDISGHWAASYINIAAANGWITGYSNGSFSPDSNITRAEAVTILNRVVGRDSIGEMHSDMTTFSDVSSSSWYYEAVQEASNSHTYEVKDGKEVWTDIIATPSV